MKKRNYESPLSQGVALHAEGVVCSSTTTYTGSVNEINPITEISIADLWN